MSQQQKTNVISGLAEWFEQKKWEYTYDEGRDRLVSGFSTNKATYMSIWEYDLESKLLTLQLVYSDKCTKNKESILQELNHINSYRNPGFFIWNEKNGKVLWIMDMFMAPNNPVKYQWDRALRSGLSIMDRNYDVFQKPA